MKSRYAFCAFALTVFVATALMRADVKVTVAHNEGDNATAAFNFKDVPSPNKMNAAANAKFTLVDGDKDETGAELEALHDGKLPAEQDEPASNFFFGQGADGGRIAIDLGSVIDIKQINTYSWHTDNRAPQVYTIYGAGLNAAKFNAAPGKEMDPTTCGWKMIAKVDTRHKTGNAGGQYGVSISDTTGTVGKYRYLLLAVSQTESDDAFGNTFFSEINVIDSKEMLGAPAPTGDRANVKTIKMGNGKYTAIIDTSGAPDLTEWADKELTPAVIEWYPKLVGMLPGDGYSPPDHFSITFRERKGGVADTSGTGGDRITGTAAWYRQNLKTEGVGSIVHEMVHVVQHYHNPKTPFWLQEGIPDYIRWYKFEPKSGGANISKRGYDKANYDGAYRISANFINYVVEKYNKDLVKDVNAAIRDKTYTDDIFKKLTGKSLDDLNMEWKADLARKLGLPAPGK